MRSIILGNGINIQFGGADYLNENIIKRSLNKIKSGEYSKEVYPEEIGTWLIYLFSQVPIICQGDYDQYTFGSDEREGLNEFKSCYKNRVAIHEVGFEDYFFVNDLCCRKNKIANPERYNFQEMLRRLFLDSIYNNGKINQIYKHFPDRFIEYLNSFENVFTTNYDRNFEHVIEKKVYYLHGAFHMLDDLYNPNGYRNQLSDKPANDAPIIQGYEHVFSTALTTNSGFYKLYSLESANHANTALDKLSEGITNNQKTEQEIETWKNSENSIIRRFYEAIKLKQKDKDFHFPTEYGFDYLKNIGGSVTFIGLSPINDTHLFTCLSENQDVSSVIYYYFDNGDKKKFLSLITTKDVEFKDVREFWDMMGNR